jgi:glycosyltransferase involved in cell wall biosynthesis
VKLLFVHQNFPGQYLHLVRNLATTGRHEIVFITEPNENVLAGVRKVPYRHPRPSSLETHVGARELDMALRRAEAVAATAGNLRGLGFHPDIVIGHHGWGELLNIHDVWPGVPVLGYLEFFYRLQNADVGFDPEFPSAVADHPRVRAKNAVNLLALTLGGHGQTPTEWQLSTYPDWARDRIELIREGVNLDVCQPDPKVRRQALTIGGMRIGPNDKLLTYVSRDLEPYRGFHMMMRALPPMLAARRDLRVVLVGRDGVSYGNPPATGSWREKMLAELGDRIDPERVLFPGRLDYEVYVRMLQRSDAHVYLTYPFVASWSLREALAAGCAVIGSDTPPVREFIADGENGLLTPFFDPKRIAERVLDVLEDKALSRRIREGARRYAEDSLAINETLARYKAQIGRLTGASVAEIG